MHSAGLTRLNKLNVHDNLTARRFYLIIIFSGKYDDEYII